ncbi:choline-sulfatase [Roseobacteraceae bacterium S113]
MTRPNIVIVMADQLAPQFTGAYGNPHVQTPHMDALAARGMRFDGAYCNSPLCAPSRFSVMSGQLVSNIRAYDNGAEFPSSIPTFAHYLQAAGYRTCLSGKMHFVGPDQLHGFQDRVTPDIYPADYAWTPDWENADDRIDRWYHNMDPVKEAGTAMATFQTDFDDETEYAARRWLVDRGRDKAMGETQPFCLVASFMHPHDPYVAKPEFWDLYEDTEIPMPDTPALAEHDPAARRVMDGILATETEVTDDDIRQARRGYFANTTYFDSKLGALVKTLEDMGELDNTVIIVTSDHGDMLGERGLWYKMTLFEHSARVPLLVAGPGVVQGVADNACSLVDVLPTLLDIAGFDDTLGAPIDGVSLWPQATGGAPARDEAVVEYCAEMTPWPVYAIRQGAMKYIHCEVDPPQLYDVVSDPAEVNNLARDPAHADTLAHFQALVAERYDCAALRADVIATQYARRAVHTGMENGSMMNWDFTPPRDASQEYVRNHMDWAVAATRYRFPPPSDT